jgi:hypothetical protein
VSLGQRVSEGEVLGTITDPITNSRARLEAPVRGRILGMALNQVVIPGFAAYRIGIEKSSEQIGQEVETQAGSEDDPGSEPVAGSDNGDRPHEEELPVDLPEESERPD